MPNSDPRATAKSGSSPQHYFTSPEGPARERRLEVELAGRRLSVTTANGIFSPGGIDKGTAVLLKHAPWEPLARSGETVLDIGCGWGPVILAAGISDPSARLVAVDVNERSLDLARRNAQAAGLSLEASQPEDVAEDLEFDRIYSNPPIRVGKEALHTILLTWLPRLARGGTAWLVVQKNLGSDSLQAWLERSLGEGFAVDRAATDKGFRILRVRRLP
ncbi:class I SAM-dependent methyltransferase [Arthrobacter sp. UM1]|uniref:class I SAM-dependent methyltransferase n=1 Tax=Arthrobacter sp. UM1 TaxID=2766776 RepID=UPI001CF6AF97|nr:methyltransferase [Arthrobacter sp. UM1]MCB4208105.1 methyltransferase [Arthrobacter sp. UM1]